MKLKYSILPFIVALFFSSSVKSQIIAITGDVSWSSISSMYTLGNEIPSGVTIQINNGAKFTIEELDAITCQGIIDITNGGELVILGSIKVLGSIYIKNLAICILDQAGFLMNDGEIEVSPGGELNFNGNGTSINRGQLTIGGFLSISINAILNCIGTFSQGLPSSGWDGSCTIQLGANIYIYGIFMLDDAPFMQYGNTHMMDGAKLKLFKSGNIQIWASLFKTDPGSSIHYYGKSGFSNITGRTELGGESSWMGTDNYAYYGGISNCLQNPQEFPKGLDITFPSNTTTKFGSTCP